jgi:hypothetical protein
MLDRSSIRAKTLWANEHAKVIFHEIGTWMNSTPYEGVPTVNAEHTHYGVIHHVLIEPKLERWALMTGDCFHNLRSALDHLVYAIAIHITGKNPPPRKRDWAFPIAKNHVAFLEKRDRIDPKNLLGCDVWGLIERVQPYHRRHQELPPLLTLLESFDNTDKHRLLQLAYGTIWGATITNIRRSDGGPLTIPEVFIEKNPKDGAEIASLTFSIPTPDVHYTFDGVVALAIKHAVGPNGSDSTDVTRVISELLEETATVLDEIYVHIH